MAKKQTVGERIAYTPRQAAELTPWGYERLLGFIKEGKLPASRNTDDDGTPIGPYIIKHADLVAFVDSIPAA